MKRVHVLVEARADLLFGKLADALDAEIFHAERGHHRAVGHGPAYHIEILPIGRSGEIPHETAREGVASPGGVHHFLYRVGGDGKDIVLEEHHRAGVAALNNNALRAHLHDQPGRLYQIVFPGELAALLLVDEEHVHLLEQLQQRGFLEGDPVIHRVAGHQPGLAHLVQDLALQVRVYIGQEEHAAAGVAAGKLGFEILEDVELRGYGLGVLVVLVVAAPPVEGLARHDLYALLADIPALQKAAERGGEILAYHAYHLYRGEL